MRRIVSACLLQTMRFDTYNDADPQKDLEIYCKKLDNGGTKYVIEDPVTEENGAIVVKIRKQYNSYPVKGYID